MVYRQASFIELEEVLFNDDDTSSVTLAFEELQRRGRTHSHARFLVGLCFLRGISVDQDLSLGSEMILGEARNGHVGAMSVVGFLFDHGIAFPVDKEEGFAWYLKAAEAGEVDGMYNAAMCYLRGDGVAPNRLAARAWLEKASLSGDERASKELKRFYR